MNETVPAECRGVDVDGMLGRLPVAVEELFLATGEQRLVRLRLAMDCGDAAAVMEATHALANLAGILPIHALAGYVQVIYAAAQRGELAAARHAHQRLEAILEWALRRARTPARMKGGA